MRGAGRQDHMSETGSDAGGRITVYSDYVCPFCYLGRRSLQAYQNSREDDLEIDWHPFDLRGHKRGSDGEIDDSIEDGKDEVYFEQVRENVAKLREQYDAGEMLDLDELPEDVDSFDAQVASWLREEGTPRGCRLRTHSFSRAGAMSSSRYATSVSLASIGWRSPSSIAPASAS